MVRTVVKKDKPDLSLILACYNESEHLLQSVKRIVEILDDSKLRYELILIDDKSKDDTPKLINLLSKKYPDLRTFFHKNNLGRGGTIQEGILLSKADIVGFIDVDLEVGPDYILHFTKIIKNNEADVVVAHRYYPFHLLPISYLVREILSRGYVFLMRFLLKLPLEDTEAGYKFFNREKILPVLEKTRDKKWFWDTEILARSFLEGLRVKEIPVLFLRRSDKTSTVKIIPDTIEYFKAISKFKKESQSEVAPPPGILYRFPSIYTSVIKFLFGKHYDSRYEKIASLISENSTVTDICCGDAILYKYIEHKNIDYYGIDISPWFILSNINKGLRMKLADVEKESFQATDYIILQGSLYQFENPKALLQKLYKSANKFLIIEESVHNLKNRSLIGKTVFKHFIPLIVGTRNKDQNFRYDENLLKQILSPFKPSYIKVNGGRDLIAVIKK